MHDDVATEIVIPTHPPRRDYPLATIQALGPHDSSPWAAYVCRTRGGLLFARLTAGMPVWRAREGEGFEEFCSRVSHDLASAVARYESLPRYHRHLTEVFPSALIT